MDKNLLLGLLIGVLVGISILSLIGVTANAYYGNMIWGNNMMGHHGENNHGHAQMMQLMHDECDDMMNESNSTSYMH